ncbi:DUF1768 domain-containing protein [Aphelenchoides besseyi]|nr:DUF1768 domain-containing protein [Aphelenchoides besseyi]KAI6218927.1 DUF1768 domain-containing protein [Aphelenchoides besseyi]
MFCRSSRSSVGFHKPPVYEGRDGRRYIAFFTKKYVFSNHFVCPNGIELEDETFPTAEHYYMFKKAKFHGDMHVARKVRKAPDAKTAKSLVSGLKNFDRRSWKIIQERIMERVCMAKFEQNETLREELLATGKAVLVEASPTDYKWGIGLSMDDKDCGNPRKWRGDNLLGRILMRVRSRLARKSSRELYAINSRLMP